MKDFILTCCSTVDLDLEFFKKTGIPFIAYSFNLDGVEYADDYGISISNEEFYNRIKNGAEPVTSQVNSERFIEFWEPYLQEGKDILHLAMSSGITGSYNSACLAKRYLDEKYPENKVYLVDTLAASSGYGMLVQSAYDLKQEGKSVEECFQWIEENKLNLHHWFFASDLTSFRRGGRISSTSFFLGKLLKICPLMNVDFNGKLIPRKKIRTKEKAIVEIVETMIENVNNGLAYNGYCYICNSACFEDAIKVKKLVEEKFVNLKDKVKIFNIGTVIGSHTGVGTVALFYYGKKRVD